MGEALEGAVEGWENDGRAVCCVVSSRAAGEAASWRSS